MRLHEILLTIDTKYYGILMTIFSMENNINVILDYCKYDVKTIFRLQFTLLQIFSMQYLIFDKYLILLEL